MPMEYTDYRDREWLIIEQVFHDRATILDPLKRYVVWQTFRQYPYINISQKLEVQN